MGYSGGDPLPPYIAQSLRNRDFMLGLGRGSSTCTGQTGGQLGRGFVNLL